MAIINFWNPNLRRSMASLDGARSQSSESMVSVSTAVVSRLPVPNNEDVRDYEVAQGRIFWLPPREELLAKAVRRAHGRGAVDEGIYNHPVIVVSRPEEDPEMVHFQLVSTEVVLGVSPR